MWLSFRDPVINKNLGCCIVPVEVIKEDTKKDLIGKAVKLAHLSHINPGGEVLGILMTKEQLEEEGLDILKLYSPAELESKGYTRVCDSF